MPIVIALILIYFYYVVYFWLLNLKLNEKEDREAEFVLSFIMALCWPISVIDGLIIKWQRRGR